MKVSVTRSGGIAGLSRTWTITVDDQPDKDDWMSLIATLPWHDRARAAPQPDRYVYLIRCSRRRILLPEQRIEGPWRELVERVRDRASE